MKITTRGRYAVMALVSLAASSRGNPVSLKNIARQEEIPEAYLQQLFSRLRRRNLVKSIRGPGGGFLLARHPSRIMIGEIIRTAERRDATIGCRRSGRTCGRIERCKTQGMWDALESRMEEFLDSISIEDLFREKPEEQTREVSA
jgi:Rrf2 family iron-sulfur cluster assembly transcriptional regulator